VEVKNVGGVIFNYPLALICVMIYVLSVSSCDFVDNKSHVEGWCRRFGENIFHIKTVCIMKHISKFNTFKLCFITQLIPLDK
jgi:hypothetical protein